MDTMPPRRRPTKLNMAASPPPDDDPYAPVLVPFEQATAQQIARAIFAAAKPPDPSKRRPARRKQ